MAIRSVPGPSDGDWNLPPVPARRVPVAPAPGVAPLPTVHGSSAEVEERRRARKTHTRRWLGLVVLACSQLLIVVDATIVNVALPALSEDLGLAQADRQWVVTAYSLTFGGLLLLCGRIADYLGLRRALVLGLLGFAVASAAGGAAQNLETLLAARAAQGAFGALLAPAALALVSTTFVDTHERAKAFAIFGMVAGGGSALGLIAGGVLTEYADWRWTMYVNVPLAVLAVTGAYVFLDEVRGHHPGRLDLIGTVLATGGLLAVVYSFSEAERNGWTETATLVLLGVGLSLLILFVVSQRMVRNPLLPLRVLADRTRAGSNLAITLAALSMIGAFFFLTFYLQGVLGFGPVKTGVAFLPVTGGVIAASAVLSALMPKLAPRLMMGLGLVGAAVALVLISQMTADSDYATDLLPALLLMGVAMGAIFVPAFNAATHGVRPQDAGVAGAVVNATQQVGASLGVALLSTVAANRTADYLAGREADAGTLIDAQVEGYARASLVAGLILAAAAVVVVLMVNVRRLSAHPALGEVPLPGPVAEPVIAAVPAQYGPVVDSAPPRDGHQTPEREPVAAPAPTPALRVAVRRPDGGPVPAAVASVLDSAGRQVGRADSDDHGIAEFPPVGEGEFLLAVRHDGCLPQVRTVLLRPPPAPTVEVEVVAPEAARLSGTVTGAAGRAVAGALVTLTAADGAVAARARTEADGSYVLVDLTAGEGTLAVFAPSGVTAAVPITVPHGGRTTHDVQVRGSGVISGVAQTPDGRLIPDARVSLHDGGLEIAVTRTDAEGRYSFSELDPGTYTVVAVGYPPAETEVQARTGETTAAHITLAHRD